jgi:hypothetical protein
MTPARLIAVKNKRRYESKKKKYGAFMAWVCKVIHSVVSKFK